MENNRRLHHSAATPQRRPIQYGRPSPAVVGAQPQISAPTQPPVAEPAGRELSVNLHLGIPKLLKKIKLTRARRLLKRVASAVTRTRRRRLMLGFILVALVFSIVMPSFTGLLEHKTYALSAGEKAILAPTSASMAKVLKYDGKDGYYGFNQDYQSGSQADEVKAGGALVKAQIYTDPTKGVQVTDTVNDIDFTIKPLFELGSGKQDQNRVVFPAFNGGGHMVYTAQSVGVKQDVTIDHYLHDTLKYSYQLGLGDSFVAKLQTDGSVGIYGMSLPLNGNVSTSSDKDKALLQKARQKAPKDKLVFSIPAPIIKETGGTKSAAAAHFELNGDKLTVIVDNLKQASYPLTIDPTVTALSATQFYFDANLETNVNVDTTNNLLARAPLTGGNLLAWNASSSTVSPHFLGGSAVYGNTLYVIGGAATTTTTNLVPGTSTHMVEQAKISSDGSVGSFSDGNSTGLPSGGVSRFQLLAYNGYLYIIDGSTTDTSGASVLSAIYYTRITSESYAAYANGAQLVNWANTITNVPTSARYDYAATVYNGVLYIGGGRTGTGYTSGLLSDVSYSTILPSGLPGSWTSTTALPAARYGMDMQPYNGHLYIIGGNLGGGAAGGTLTETVLYSSITTATGAIADSSWKTGNSLVNTGGTAVQAMENLGSTFTMIYNGFLYVTGGCTAVNASQSCTAVASYAQLAQVNADGSLGTWFPNDFPSTGTTSLQRTGTPTVGYNGVIYSVAGCSVMLSTAVSCSTTSLTSNYSKVNATVGDISNNRNPTGLPVALFGHSTTVLNGYLYVVGGCTTVSCTGTRTENYTTYYALINADGTLGSFTNNTASTDSTALGYDKVSGTDCAATGTDLCGLAGAAVATYNGYIYVIGGYDGNAYSSAVYYMAPNVSTGATTAWTKSGNTINTAVTELGAFANNGFLYIMGGCNGTTGIGCSGYIAQVQKSTLNATTGAPSVFTNTNNSTNGTQQLQLPANGRSAFGITYYGGFIYLAGGIDSANNQLATVVRAKINSSGDIVAATGTVWTAVTGTMSQPRRRTVAQVVNGYLYVIGGHNAADTTGPPGGANGTTYGDIQIGKIDLSSGSTGDIASFTKSSTSTLTARWNPAVAFGNGFMFVTGGCTAGPPPASCTTVGTTDESFIVYNADNLGTNTWNAPTHTYAASSPDPAQVNRLGAASVAYNGYLYVAGGCTTFTISTLTCSATTNTTSYAPINADGTLGTFTAGPTLSAAVAYGQMVALNGYLYYMGGQTAGIATALSTMYYSQIDSTTAAPGSWTATTRALGDVNGSTPVTNTQFSAVTYSNRIFMVGGYSGSANRATVYVSPALASGGDVSSNWTSTTAITNARRELSLVSAGAYLYMMGGYDGTNYYADVQAAAPNTSTGVISSWSYNSELPYRQAGMSAVGSNGFIYTFGGRNGVASTSCTNKTYFAAVNSNGTVGTWQQAANTLASGRFGTAAAYSKGYFLVSGGHDCTNVVSTNVIQQSGQLSQAIHATYTRYVDFGTDATLRQLYVLGTNAVISGNDIDTWSLVVKTSTEANNTWGKKYTTSLTGLNVGPNYGTPITFQSLDAAGVNTGAARYWDMTFDIDQSQSFSFPDSTQPTITKYDFYFSAGPAKRLRLGKTFVNEQQTTLDAHP